MLKYFIAKWPGSPLIPGFGLVCFVPVKLCKGEYKSIFQGVAPLDEIQNIHSSTYRNYREESTQLTQSSITRWRAIHKWRPKVSPILRNNLAIASTMREIKMALPATPGTPFLIPRQTATHTPQSPSLSLINMPRQLLSLFITWNQQQCHITQYYQKNTLIGEPYVE